MSEELANLEWLVDLAEEIAADTGEADDTDILEVCQRFDLTGENGIFSAVSDGLAEAVEFYVRANAFDLDDMDAFAKYVDDDAFTTAKAEYWQQEFADRGRSECRSQIAFLEMHKAGL